MNAKTISQRTVADYSIWQVAGRLVLLAGILMAYSYCFLLTINAVINHFHTKFEAYRYKPRKMRQELRKLLHPPGGVEAVYRQLNDQVLFNLRKTYL